ncbi:MAG: hypothetical protein K0S16_815, partial [Moraxellaceae bacterium]|nr:hypothetical protein [Moraxellaceae bacterium]
MSMQWTARATLLALAIAALGGCNDDSSISGATPTGVTTDTTSVTVTPLVSRDSLPDAHQDSGLVNPSGLVFSDTNAWVANSATGTLTAIDAQGTLQQPIVHLADGSNPEARPTGLVFAGGGSDFQINRGAGNAPATLIYATEAGTLGAWSNTADFGNRAVTVFDDSDERAMYTGLALLNVGGSRFLFAADFRNGRIVTFDNAFNPVTTSGTFEDPDIPDDHAPFGIQAIGDRLIVTYARRVGEADDRADSGAGQGYVSEFDGR